VTSGQSAQARRRDNSFFGPPKGKRGGFLSSLLPKRERKAAPVRGCAGLAVTYMAPAKKKREESGGFYDDQGGPKKEDHSREKKEPHAAPAPPFRCRTFTPKGRKGRTGWILRPRGGPRRKKKGKGATRFNLTYFPSKRFLLPREKEGGGEGDDGTLNPYASKPEGEGEPIPTTPLKGSHHGPVQGKREKGENGC